MTTMPWLQRRRITVAIGLVLAWLTGASAAPHAGPWRFNFTDAAATADAIQVTATDTYSPDRGFGFERNSASPATTGGPILFSVAVPEGNYRVTLGFASSAADLRYTVKAESRQLMLEAVPAIEGILPAFLVNVRNAHMPPPEKNAPGGTAVVLNERETGLLRWDDKLTLELSAANAAGERLTPRVTSLTIEPAEVTTVFLAGDSTVTDQPAEPAASWGQMLPRFLSQVAVANHAESGETLKSFLSGLRLAKILSQIKPGDYLFIQFGHNDQKKNWPQTYVEAATTYEAYLRVFIAEARLRGATPVLVTSMQRRNFDAAGKIRNTLGDYPSAVRHVAATEKVALIDLERMSIAFYEALGPERAPLAFSAGGKDATHHNNYGAYELARSVVQGIRDAGLPLAQFISADVGTFDPAHPDAPETFQIAVSPSRSDAALRGN